MANTSAGSLFELGGAIALVSGGGTGIGLMAARALASQGAKVYITGRRAPVLEAAAKHHNGNLSEHGGSLVPLQLDVSDKSSLEKAVDKITQDEGKLHILVNNAGVEGPVTKFTEDDVKDIRGADSEQARADLIRKKHWDSEDFDGWTKLFTPNVSAIFFATMAFVPLLVKGNADPPTGKAGRLHGPNRWTASVINVTSISGLVKKSQNHFAYNASKAAANHLTHMLSSELMFGPAAIGVRVNAIAPGLFPSEMTTKKETIQSGGMSSVDDVDASMTNPAGRLGLEEDMAQSVCYLASCLFLTGQVIAVDGGFVACFPSSR